MEKRNTEPTRTLFLTEIKSRLMGPSSDDEEMRERPHKRYLTGMLFPRGATAGKSLADEEDLARDIAADEEEPPLESPMDLLFQKLPASVGLTFAIESGETIIRVAVRGARYRRQKTELLGREVPDRVPKKGNQHRKDYIWKRVPLGDSGRGEVVEFDAKADASLRKPLFDGHASLQLLIRRVRGVRIATLSLVNERDTPEDSGPATEDILFQIGMQCTPSLGVVSYPEPPLVSEDPEAEELALQYRALPSFAVGHGCGVDWPDAENGRVEWVAVDYLPAVEVPPVTADIAGLPATVQDVLSIQRLQDSSYDPVPSFREFVSIYAAWRDRLEGEDVPARFRRQKEDILARIGRTIARMEDGIALLEEHKEALGIFRLANRAMLLGIARTAAIRDRGDTRFTDIDLSALAPDVFRWRPFQLAFFLLSLRGLWDPDHRDHSIVDLIWFPTGGGKTEAYLAVAAFELIRRRVIEGESGAGTAIIKRYTLRLLTIQQFERAGSLICALETLRRSGQLPGSTPFSLGLWVGSDSSPNDYKAARNDLAKIHDTIGRVEGIKVPLKQCPVCGTPIVPMQKDEGAQGVGMREVHGAVELFCPNVDCLFSDFLPISFIDEYLYANPPSMLLGTVDKFAMLTWRPEARAFFGTDSQVCPPSLIIQDELHLISGPLGTLAGIYEAAVDSVISERGSPAKYICATATIRRADDQIAKLYGRQAALFPPPGLDASDSFFSTVATDTPGRLYVGGMGQGHTPTFSNVITSSALLAAAGEMRQQIGDDVDPWWTLVAYHNSKRELGKTLSLARDDIPARLQALGEPRSVAASGVRELSANLKDSQIPEALYDLSISLPDGDTLDFVACTNMLSVGVDVQRLGLMLVNGQPKTVSEYIQASSRVGRDSRRLPGVVVALFSPTKPRDRSHYEFFRSFHKAYYRHVEPTSVTPFALPAQDRGLHGAFVALIRMTSDIYRNEHASRIEQRFNEVKRLAERFLERADRAQDGDIEETRERLFEFVEYWRERARERMTNLRFHSRGREHASLIRPFKSRSEGWETLQSLRHVDVPLKLILPTLQLGNEGAQP